MAAQETTLDQYVLTKSFTGKKWKLLSNTRLGNSETVYPRKMSTKTLADVAEALVGAAFLDGGFLKVLSCLKILLPEVSWLPLAERNNILLHAIWASVKHSRDLLLTKENVHGPHRWPRSPRYRENSTVPEFCAAY